MPARDSHRMQTKPTAARLRWRARASLWVVPAVFLWITAACADERGGYPLHRGRLEVRPLVGAIAAIAGQPNQGSVGADVAWGRSRDRSIVFGGWIGFAERYLGVELHFGMKHRFTRAHSRVVPFLEVGGGISAGFHTSGETPVTGVGLRMGGGFEVFATPSVLPGLRILFDLGPRFTPSFDLLGSAQITFGCTFLL